jgi:hypothetical protein
MGGHEFSISKLNPVVFEHTGIPLNYYSKNSGIPLFKEHITCYYFDWLFVPFNMVFPYTVGIRSYYILPIFIFSLFASIIIHVFWFKIHKNENKEIYLYDLKLNRITKPGLIHLIFLIFQMGLVVYFILFSEMSAYSIFGLMLLFTFFLGTQVGSKMIHGNVIKSDLTFFVLGILVIALKILSWAIWIS